MKRFGIKSLAGQLIALLLAGLIVSQMIGIAVVVIARQLAVQGALEEDAILRVAYVVRLLRAAPEGLDAQIVNAATSGLLRFSVGPRGVLELVADGHQDDVLAARLQAMLTELGIGTVRIQAMALQRSIWGDLLGLSPPASQQIPGLPAPPGRERPIPTSRSRRVDWRVISTELAPGRWLNAVIALPYRGFSVALLSMAASLVLMVTVVALVVVVVIRRLTTPLARLAQAADHLGRGAEPEPLPEEGPEDLRQTIRAFNRMNARLRRYLEDRTRVLAAISHDLRTPITSLRLRAEFVEDDEVRRKMLATLDHMQHITEATLAFTREDAKPEPTRAVDLAALVDSVCADLADQGREVSFSETDGTPYSCRPVSLTRALRNLVQNAVAYGHRARVALELGAEEFRIVIDDDGPGIPLAERERVFEPFVRLESARSAETGGVGLGLTIARSIVRGHGGDIVFADSPSGGLRVIVRLPYVQQPNAGSCADTGTG